MGFASVRVDRPNVRGGQDPRQVIRLHVPDAGIGRARNLTAGDHIPHRDMVRKQHGLLLRNPLRLLTSKHLCQDTPETVLLMSVEKLLFSRFH